MNIYQTLANKKAIKIKHGNKIVIKIKYGIHLQENGIKNIEQALKNSHSSLELSKNSQKLWSSDNLYTVNDI